MDKDEIKRIFNLLLVDHNPEEFLKYCTDDVKIILHPRHVAAGIYDRKSIFNLFMITFRTKILVKIQTFNDFSEKIHY